MFARFRLDGTNEVNVNVGLVRDFEPGTEEGTTKLNFLGGDSRIIPFSNRAVRHAFKTAMAPASEAVTGDTKPVIPSEPGSDGS